MEYVIFDLEWNGCYCKQLGCFVNEIIEIGAVRLDSNLKIVSEFQILVRPEISRWLTSSVRNLTSLSLQELKKGVSFKSALEKFSDFCSGAVMMTWSTSDLDALISNIQYHYDTDRISFMKEYADLQQYCQEMLGMGDTSSLGLQTAVEMLGIDTESIHHHRALGDSYMTALCLQRLYSEGALRSCIRKADNEFYKRLSFRSYNLTEADKCFFDGLTFNCPFCGKRAKQKGGWTQKCYSFTSLFVCPGCRSVFKGRVQFKKKYDGIVTVKKIQKK